jgi:perosamine synthetase
LARKKAIGAKYTALLSDVKHIQLPVAKTPHSENVYWVYGIVLTNGLTGNQISGLLAKEGVATRSFFCPIHLQPALLKTGLFMEENYPRAENLWEYGIYLPSGVGITDEEIEYVSKCVTNILK